MARIESWEYVDGAAGMHPPDRQENPFEARYAIKRLVDLGYIDPPDENTEVAAAKADREAKFNLSLVYLDSGKVDQAAELLTTLYEQHPDQARFGLNLTRCHLARRRFDEARKVANAVLDDSERRARNTVKRLDDLQEKVHQRAALIADGTKPVSDSPEKLSPTSEEASTEPADKGVNLEEMELTPEQVELADRRIAAFRHQYSVEDVRATPQAKLLLGVVELEDRRISQAMTYLREAEQLEPQLPGLHLQIGRAYLRMRRWNRALGAYQRALDVDGDSAIAFDGMAVAWLHMRQPEKAVECALNAVGLMHYLADAHLHLGVALARLKMFEQAVEAFQTCSQIAPQLIGPRRWLRAIYRSRLNQRELADSESIRIAEIEASAQSG